MSELLDRIQREISERLEATRAAVLEHERLEAALHALGDAGSRATRAVRGGGRGSGAAGSARRSSAAAERSGPRAPAGKRRSAAAKRAAGRASASARRSSAAGAGGGGERARAGAGGRAPSAPTKKRRTARAAAGTPARGRAPRGANRAAVLRVIGERPGVSARELADASQVTGGTLYTLLRRLVDDGTVEKRELPGGQTGYALATSPAPEQSAAAPPQTAPPDEPRIESPAAHEQDRADTTETADPARSTATEAQPSQAPPNATTDADEQPTPAATASSRPPRRR